MRTLGAFDLHIQPGDEHEPARVFIALAGIIPDDDGLLHLTPDCFTLDQVEGCINTLQDELDVLRAQARRAFSGSVGHA